MEKGAPGEHARRMPKSIRPPFAQPAPRAHVSVAQCLCQAIHIEKATTQMEIIPAFSKEKRDTGKIEVTSSFSKEE
jgi:hypothetical protein